jgi:uncharacterized protein (TIGR02453 family)
METINKGTIEFLSMLKKNNEREWFNKNRKEYETARTNYTKFVQEVIERTVKFDPILKGLEAGHCIFRINRDTRFASDKSPYKTNFGAFIVRGGRKNGDKFTGYYLHIEKGGSFIAGGAYMPPSPWLNAIRERVASDPEKLKKIIASKDFIEFFGQIEGEKLKSAPRGYSSDHPQIELLKHKSYLVMHHLKDADVLRPDFQDFVIAAFKAMKPLNDFLNVN